MATEKKMQMNKSSRIAATAMIALSAAASAQAQELLTNNDFEQGGAGPGAPGYITFNAAETSTEQAMNDGGKSFKTFGPFFNADPAPGAGGVQAVPATPGTAYRLNGFMLSPVLDHVRGNNFALLEMQFLDANKVALPGVTVTRFFYASSSGGVWLPYSLDGVAPAGASFVQAGMVHVQLTTPVEGGAIYFDNLSLRAAPQTTGSVFSTSGSWTSGTTWTGSGVPNGIDTEANLNNATANPASVTIPAAGVTSGTIRFHSPNASFTVSGPGSLTMDVTTGDASLGVTAGNHTISAPLVLNDTTAVGVAPGATLNLTGNLTLAGGSQLMSSGQGTVHLASPVINGSTGAAVRANGGVLQVDSDLGNNVDLIAESGELRSSVNQHPRSAAIVGLGKLTLSDVATTRVLRTSSFSIAPTGTLQLADNGLVLDYTEASPAAAIRTAITAGVAGNNAGTGIISSKAVADSRYAVGYAEASQVLSPTTFLGETGIDSTTVLVRSTLKGDTTLNGLVDFDDLVSLAQNYNGTGKEWFQGDFNYDGVVNFDDLVPLAQNYNSSVSLTDLSADFGSSFAQDWVLAQSLAPEPTSIAALGLTTMLLRRRRA